MKKKINNKESATSSLKMQPRGIQGAIKTILALIVLDTGLYREVGEELRKSQMDFIVKNRSDFTITELATRFNCHKNSIVKFIRRLKDEGRL